MHKRVRALHRWISLGLAIFWLLQAASGLFLVFHGEIDDWRTAAEARQLDPTRLGSAIERLEARHRGYFVSSVFLTSAAGRHFDISLEDQAGRTHVVRVDGEGKVLLQRPLDAPITDGGLYIAVNRLHRTLLAGELGGWIVGVSGIFLLSNILLGLKLAWPGPGQWRRTLLPKPARSKAAKLYGFHRALGLWLGPIAVLTVSSGVLLAFERGTARLLGVVDERPAATRTEATAAKVPASTALLLAVQRFPGSEFSGMILPFGQRAFYEVHLRQAGEPRQTHGASRVYVSATTGRILSVDDALEAPPARRFLGLLFPIHSGQIGGTPGRVGIMIIGLWLLATAGLGLSLWNTRRKLKAEQGQKTKKEKQAWA